jgi:hypothetical protein
MSRAVRPPHDHSCSRVSFFLRAARGGHGARIQCRNPEKALNTLRDRLISGAADRLPPAHRLHDALESYPRWRRPDNSELD